MREETLETQIGDFALKVSISPRQSASHKAKRDMRAERIARTKGMLRKHMFYSATQLERTGEIADELMQRKIKARTSKASQAMTSEIITRNTVIRASIDAVLSFFEVTEADFVDNEEELTLLILEKMKEAFGSSPH